MNHAGVMKQSGELRPEEMKRLVGYVWALQFAAEAGDPARGAKVFAAKACAGCHTSGPGPKIAGAVPDAYTLIGSLTQHAPGHDREDGRLQAGLAVDQRCGDAGPARLSENG